MVLGEVSLGNDTDNYIYYPHLPINLPGAVFKHMDNFTITFPTYNN